MLNNIRLLIFLIAFCQSAIAQTGLSIEGLGGYLYSYRFIKEKDASSSIIDKNTRDKIEKPMSGCYFSLGGIYQFKSNFCISLAIATSYNGFQTKKMNYTSGDTTPPFGIDASVSGIPSLKVMYRFNYLSVPIMVGYKLSIGQNQKHSVLFRAGICNHLLQQSLNKVQYELRGMNEETLQMYETTDMYSKYSLSACTNIGYYYQLNKHNIGINLLGDFGLTPQNKNTSEIKQYGYYVGIGLSYFYRLSK